MFHGCVVGADLRVGPAGGNVNGGIRVELKR